MSNSLQLHGLQPTMLLHPWDFPGNNNGLGCHFLLQGIFPTQGSNPGLLHCRQTLYRLSHQGSQRKYLFLCQRKRWYSKKDPVQLKINKKINKQHNNIRSKSLKLLSVTLYLCAQQLSCVQLFAIPWTVCSLPGSSVHVISQARILECVAISFSGRFS